MGVRRPRRSVVALVGSAPEGEAHAQAVADSIRDLGVDALYLGLEENPARIVAAAVDHNADAVELCLASATGVVLLRQLLRELTGAARRDVSIVVHRVPALPPSAR